MAFNVDITPTTFSVTFEGTTDLVSRREVICQVVFPAYNSYCGFGEDVVTGASLGQISVNKEIGTTNYFSNAPTTYEVDNTLSVSEIEDYSFLPCDLDINSSGVITYQDIELIYFGDIDPGTKFDLNNDGSTDIEDAIIADQYVGTVCPVCDQQEEYSFPGVYDDVPNMKWGYSLNRLLRGSHSNKPLFRVIMPVNTFASYDVDDPAVQITTLYVDPFQNSRLDEVETYYHNAVIKPTYGGTVLVGQDQRGEILMQDIFWKGSEDKIREDILIFYSYGKELQEQNGFHIEEDFYTNPYTKWALNTVSVCKIYDQSGNNKHAYSYCLGNSTSYSSSESPTPPPEATISSTFSRAPMIYSLGRFFENPAGRLSLSGDGYQKDNSNPYGFSVGQVGLSNQIKAMYLMLGHESISNQYAYSPYSDPGEPVYMYSIGDYSYSQKTAPFGDVYDGDITQVRKLHESVAAYTGKSSFQDIFDGETGKLLEEVTDLIIPATNHSYQYTRAIFHLYAQAGSGPLGGNPSSHYLEVTGNSVSILNNAYTVYLGDTGLQSDIINPDTTQYGTGDLDGDGIINTDAGETNYVWSRPVWYELFTKVYIPQEPYPGTVVSLWDIVYNNYQPFAGYRQGPKDIYVRLMNNAAGDDYNRDLGANVFQNNQTIVLSMRYHDDNVDVYNPAFDLRLNNKKQLVYSRGSLNRPSFMMPRAIGGLRNGFYEMAAFTYDDNESYETVMADVNEYFGTQQPPDAPYLEE